MRNRSRSIPGSTLPALIVSDPWRDGAATLVIDGTSQSHVDLREPARLTHEYTQHIAAIVDGTRAWNAPLRILHLGGGGLTMPRYFDATRPESSHHVVELHRELFEFVLDELPLPDGIDLTAQFADASEAVRETVPGASGTFDVAIVDAFAGNSAPPHLSTAAFFGDVARLLAPDGMLVVNTIAQQPGLEESRTTAATLATMFPHLVAVASSAVLGRMALGNVVVAASPAPIPGEAVRERTRGCLRPARVLDSGALADFIGDALPRQADRT